MAENQPLKELRKYWMKENDPVTGTSNLALMRYDEPAGTELPNIQKMLRSLQRIKMYLAQGETSSLAARHDLQTEVNAALVPDPGQFDNAHVNLWQQVQLLEDQLAASASPIEAAKNELAAFVELHEQLQQAVESAAELVGITHESGVGVMVMPSVMADRLQKAETALQTVVQDSMLKLAEIYEGRARQYMKRALGLGMKRDKLYADCYREMAAHLRKAFNLPITEVTDGSGR